MIVTYLSVSPHLACKFSSILVHGHASLLQDFCRCGRVFVDNQSTLWSNLLIEESYFYAKQESCIVFHFFDPRSSIRLSERTTLTYFQSGSKARFEPSSQPQTQTEIKDHRSNRSNSQQTTSKLKAERGRGTCKRHYHKRDIKIKDD